MRAFLIACALIFAPTFTFGLGKTDGVLTQEMLNEATNTFVVRKNYNLLGQTLVVPDGLSLLFLAGGVDNGELQGTNSKITVLGKSVFGLDLKISGTWDVPEVHDGWFAFDSSPEAVSNQVISNILALSNDSTFCHIFFEENRTYYYELPYKGRGDFGNMVSTTVTDGETRRNYSDLTDDKYDYLRIFTIPSNTHLTINNRLKMLPTAIGAYFVFWEYGKKNITIDGNGTIAGDNDWHLYDKPVVGKNYYGEWGHIFRCSRCTDFTFRNITLSDSFGDCIYYTGSYNPDETGPRWGSGLTMDHVTILRARRNGVALGARNIRIRNCHFEECGTESVKGTNPRCGINFEPASVRVYRELGNEDALVENCTFVDNKYDFGSSMNNMPGYGKIATVVRNCRFPNEVKISATYWIQFDHCSFTTLPERTNGGTYSSNYLEFVNCDFGEEKSAVVGLLNKKANKFIDCRFNAKNDK